MSKNPPPSEPESDGVPELFRDADADIILLSSDNQEFHVHRIILSKASPVFCDMLSLPQNLVSEKPLPIVQMSESARALTILLEHIYPELPEHHPVSFIDLSSIGLTDIKLGLELSRKFQMSRLRERFHKSMLARAKEAPESVYAIGWEMQMNDVVQAAAHESLRNPLVPGTDVPEFALISALALQKLMQYQRRCMAAVNIDVPRFRGSLSSYQRGWLGAYCKLVNSALAEAPHEETVTNLKYIALSCGGNSTFKYSDFDNFLEGTLATARAMCIEKLADVRPSL